MIEFALCAKTFPPKVCDWDSSSHTVFLSVLNVFIRHSGIMQKADLVLVELKPRPNLRKSGLQKEAWW